MSDSIKKKNSIRQKQNKYYINCPLIKKCQNSTEFKKKNEKRLKLHNNSKTSLNECCLCTSFDKNSKTIDKNALQSTIHKLNDFVDYNKEIKKNKMKIKNKFFSKITKITLSLKENKKNNSDSFHMYKGGNTNRDNLSNKKTENIIDKDSNSLLTQRQQFKNKLCHSKALNAKKGKHNSFNRNIKKNNLFLKIMENVKNKEYFPSRNLRYINTNNKNNKYLIMDSLNKTRKNNHFLSDKKAFKTFMNNSIKHQKKNTPDILPRNSIRNNIAKNFDYFGFNNYKSIFDEKDSRRIKTLVLDLDETLIFTSFEPSVNTDLYFEIDLNINEQNIINSKNNRINSIPKKKKVLVKVYLSKRPYLAQFLSELYPFYEICIFSASSQKYASSIIDIIDTNKVISKRFFREDCIHLDNSETFSYIKDLEKIQKDYNDIIIIDDNVSSFILQEENGIPIKSWRGDKNDIELLKLIPILKNLSGFYDVRTEIKQFVINRTFIWFQGIKWLCNNCLSYSYIKDMIKVMKIEQIPFADKILFFFIEGENNNNKSIIFNNKSFIENEINKNNLSLSPNKYESNNFIKKKGQRSYEKRKRGKSVNFFIISDNKPNLNLSKNSLNNRNKINQKKIINNIRNKRKTRSKSAFQKQDFEKEKYLTNKINENLKKKKNIIKNNNLKKYNNNDIYILKSVKKRDKDSYSISNS